MEPVQNQSAENQTSAQLNPIVVDIDNQDEPSLDQVIAQEQTKAQVPQPNEQPNFLKPLMASTATAQQLNGSDVKETPCFADGAGGFGLDEDLVPKLAQTPSVTDVVRKSGTIQVPFGVGAQALEAKGVDVKMADSGESERVQILQKKQPEEEAKQTIDGTDDKSDALKDQPTNVVVSETPQEESKIEAEKSNATDNREEVKQAPLDAVPSTQDGQAEDEPEADQSNEGQKKQTNSRVEAIIRQKLGRNFNAADFDESMFDLLLLEGLDLGGELTTADKAFLERFTEAKTMNLSYCYLRSLKNLPVIAGLERLDLADNNLNGEDLHIVHSTYKKLRALKLSNNAIRNLDYVALLSKLPELKTLDLSANPITDMNNYRQNVFEKLPNLEALDGYNIEGSDCSFEANDDLRADVDDFQDNEFCGGFFESATFKLRQGGSADQSQEDEGSEEADGEDAALDDDESDDNEGSSKEPSHNAENGQKDSLFEQKDQGSGESSISDGDPCKRPRLN